MAVITYAFPLSWPNGYPKRERYYRRESSFNVKDGNGFAIKLTIATAVNRLNNELDLIRAKSVILTSDIQLGRTGIPLSSQPKVDDPSCVLYFRLGDRQTTLPCDRYTRVADNIAALAAHIAATRAIERHGVGTLDQMFTAFQSIRGPGPKPWREVLGMEPHAAPSRMQISDRHRMLARKFHPDAGGSDAMMAEINAARDAAFMEITA